MNIVKILLNLGLILFMNSSVIWTMSSPSQSQQRTPSTSPQPTESDLNTVRIQKPTIPLLDLKVAAALSINSNDQDLRDAKTPSSQLIPPPESSSQEISTFDSQNDQTPQYKCDYELAIAALDSGKWQNAKSIFEELAFKHNYRPAEILLSCESFDDFFSKNTKLSEKAACLILCCAAYIALENKAKTADYAEQLYSIAQATIEGEDGSINADSQQYADALFILQWLADRLDHEFALNTLCNYFFNTQQYIYAYSYALQAQKLNYPFADNLLGLCHYQSDNEDDNKKAFELFQKAAKAGYAPALAKIGLCYQHGIGVTINQNKALHYFWQASAKGDESGLYYYGLCLRDSSPQQAYAYIRAAANKGYKQAQNWLMQEPTTETSLNTKNTASSLQSDPTALNSTIPTSSCPQETTV